MPFLHLATVLMREFMRRIAGFIGIVLLVSGLVGCASSGVFPSTHVTDVRLSDTNFQIVASNMTGEAEAEYILGVSGAFFSEMRTFALVRISDSGMLYRDAIQNLWANFEEEHGAAEGRSLALVNVRFDSDVLNLLVYTRPSVSVQADVVEFLP